MLKHLGVALLLCAQILLGWGSANAATVNTIVNTPGSALDVALADSYAYVADKNGGLRVIDISAPANPKQVAAVATPGSANSVALYGDYALVADSSVGLQLYNISSPLSPQAYAQLGITGSAVDVSVVGAMAYVAGGSGGLSLVNLDDMLSPFVSGRCVLSGSAQMVAMIDDLAYVAAGSGGVQLVDVGNPYDPTVIGQLATSSSVNQLSVAGDIIFAACADGTMLTIDASDPSEPVLAQKATPSGSSRALRVSTDLAYVADKANGLRVISIGDQLPGKLISPNGGEQLVSGQSTTIAWQSVDSAANYALKYSLGDGQWQSIATVGAGSTQYTWTVPSISTPAPESRVRVQGLNSSSSVVADDVSDSTFTISFSAGSIATLNVPASATSSSITASWSASSVAGVTYQLQMSKDGGAYQTAYKGTSRSLTVAGLSNGSYRFRVRALKTNYVDGAWSSVKTTAISGVSGSGDGPACGMPSAVTVPATTTAAIPLSWTASSTAGVTYQAQMSSNGGSTWTTVYSGSATSKSVSVSAEGSYLFRVKAVKSGLASSGWAFSSTCLTDLGIPTSISVPATSSNGAMTISWGASATSGASYVLQISNDGGSSYMEAYSGSATSSTVQVSSNGTYKFRVRAIKSGYSVSGWRSGGSCAVTFTCAAPASISVTANAAAKNFTVSWPVSTTSGSSYVLQMSVDGGAYSQVYSGSSLSQTVAVSTSGSYQFRVKAQKSGYVTSGWRTSTAKSITLQAEGVALSAPTTGTTDTDGTYTISWGTSQYSGATYVVQEATSSDFSTGLKTVASYVTSNSIELTGRQDYDVFYYRVKVIVAGYVDSNWSNTIRIEIVYPQLTGTFKISGSSWSVGSNDGQNTFSFNKGSFPSGTTFSILKKSGCSATVYKNKYVKVSGVNGSFSFTIKAENPLYRGILKKTYSGRHYVGGD